ncbi:MAG: response regulator [Candidatus Eremiobacteraeota bacterium]|nr:response regulator [Candidatus Eremiobacteraeota bacterium]MCW5871312.1 response regulator [Candidatus Eremiobacteraeota bacterium]
MTKRFSTLLGQFGDATRRELVSNQLAQCVGAEQLLIFVRDPGSGEWRSGLGFKNSRLWKKLVEKAARQQTAETHRQKRVARAYAQGDAVLLLLGGQPKPQPLLDTLPLLATLLRHELNTDPEERSDFLGYANHEIRTPMAAMMGYVDILLRQSEDPDDRHYLEVIHRNGQLLLETLNDLFDLSRIRLNQLQVEKEPFELTPLIAEIRGQMEPEAQEKGLGLQIFFDTLVPRSLSSDRSRLRQILVNLLSNAIKYTERGWVRLSIRWADGELEFAVVDSGVGLDPETLPKLLHTQSIGLSISHQLVRLLGGKLEVSSESGKGTCFRFRLETPGPDLIDGNIELLTAPLQDYQLPDLAGLTTLVVDDREDIREIVRNYLEEAGATVYTTGEGQTALDFLKTKTVSVIVLDMHMPGMDGYATARALREQGLTTPILALTASANRGDRTSCMEAGCNSYLSKPVDRSALIGQVWTLAYTLQVLVVEDSPLAAHALKSMLESMGCTVEMAHSGAETRARLAEGCPTVILMDLGLPDVDGWDLLEWLRQHCPDSRVLAHTGRRPEEMIPPRPGLAFDGYLQKPAARKSLLQSLFPR